MHTKFYIEQKKKQQQQHEKRVEEMSVYVNGAALVLNIMLQNIDGGV